MGLEEGELFFVHMSASSDVWSFCQGDQPSKMLEKADNSYLIYVTIASLWSSRGEDMTRCSGRAVGPPVTENSCRIRVAIALTFLF